MRYDNTEPSNNNFLIYMEFDLNKVYYVYAWFYKTTKGEWKCTFNKHKSLENISIKRIINEGVSTNPDECKDVV